MSNSPTTLIRPWKGFANLRVYPAELRRDLEELESFMKDIRQAVGKMVGEVSITNTTITTVSASTTIFADYGLDGGGQLTSDVHISLDPEAEATGTEAWTGSHAWLPSFNSEPVTITKTAGLLSADLVRILDADSTPLFVVDNGGLVGINCEPDCMLTIQGGGALSPPIASPTAWYRADSLALTNGDAVDTWADSSGNGNHLTGAACTTSNVNLPLVRPKYNAAGQSKATTNLPTVSFEGTNIAPTQLGYFTIDTAPLNFTFAAGWTICMIVRDYSGAISNPSLFFGINAPAQDTNVSDNIRFDHSVSNANWIIQNGVGSIPSGDANYSTIYSHTNGDATEAIVLRVGAGGNLLKTWVNGTAQTSTSDTRHTNYVMRYIGRHVSSAASVSGVYDKAVAEIIIYNTALSDADVAIVNTYLLNRVAGTASSTSYDLTRWKKAIGTTVASIDSNGVLNITTTTTPQVQIGYDTSNYYTTSVSSTGIVTFDATGAGQSFVFADPVSFSSSITTSDSIYMPDTTSSTVGIIFKNSIRYIHNYGNTTVRSIFMGKNAGNFTMSTGTTLGKANLGVGEDSLKALTQGSQNVALGWQALQTCTTGNYNMAIGTGTMNNLTIGAANVGVGLANSYFITSGQSNVAIGDSAGGIAGYPITGVGNVLIGAQSDLTGDWSNAIAIGYNTVVGADNTISLGNSTHTATNIYGVTTINVPASGSYAGATVLLDPSILQFASNGAASPTFAGMPIVFIAGDGDPGGSISLTTGAGFSGGDLLFKATGGGGGAHGKYRFYEPGGLNTGDLVFTLLTGTRTYTFPDLSGTILLSTTGFGNPTALVGNTAVNGTATTAMRSDGAPALDLTLARNWSAGVHTFAVQDIHNAGIRLGSTGITSAPITSAVDDGATAIGFDFNDSTTRTTGFARQLRQGTQLLEAVSWDGRFSFGYSNSLAPSVGHVLSFVSNDTSSPTGAPIFGGIFTEIIHSDTAETAPRLLGVCGAVNVQTVTGLSAVVINGVTGALSSSFAAAAAGKVLACFSGALSQAGGISNDEPITKDITFGMNSHPAGGYDHLTVLWCPNFSSASATGYPADANLPAIASSVRATIQDWGAPTTNAANTKEYWAIYGETGVAAGGTWGADETFPAVTGYLRMVYPRRFNKTTGGQARAMHAWWEPWPNTAAVRGAAASGDTYFDDGTNFPAGLWEFNKDAAGGAAAWNYILNSPGIDALGGGAAATLGTIGGTGPAAAAQATWVQVNCADGVVRWIPAWV